MIIAQGGRLADVSGAELAPFSQDLKEYRGEALPRTALRLQGDRRAGSHRFEASPVAARTDRAFGIHADVAYVPGATLDPPIETPVGVDPTAYPGADLYEEHVVYTLAHPSPVLSERHYVDVVVDEHRGRVLPGERIPYGKQVPPRHDRGRPQEPRGLLDRTGHAHPDGQDILRPRRLFIQEPRKKLLDPTQYGLRTVPDVRGLPLMRQQPAAERREGDVDRGSPEVNRGYQPGGARDPQERRAPVTLRLRQTVLHQKASLEQPPDLHRDLAPAHPEVFR